MSLTLFQTAQDNGTHVGNPFRQGNYFDPQAGNGVISSPIYVYDIVPAAATTNSIVTSVMPAQAGYLTLAGGSGGVTITTLLGVRVAQLDVPRVVTITSSGNDSGINFTVWGYDYLGNAMTELIAGPNTTTVSGDKAFAYVSYIYCSAATAGNITVGTGDTFGLPYAILNGAQIISNWNYPTNSGLLFGTVTLTAASPAATVLTTAVASDSTIALYRQAVGGTPGHLSIGAITPATSFTILASGNLDTSTVAWQILTPQPRLISADLTDPATSTTGDVRGTLTVPTVSNGGRRLTAWMYVQGAVGDQTFNTYYGVDQYTQALI